jgi:uncharacterized membrane protein
MITVAGVVFSITIVSLSLAASQYTPRVLRNFMRDRTNQVVFGSFTAIFTYCLLVLRTIRGGEDEFVPSVAVALGVLLGLGGIAVLILFIHHTVTSIQVAHVLASIANEGRAAVQRLFPSEIGEGVEDPTATRALQDEERRLKWRVVRAPASAYLQDVNADALLDLARKHRRVVRLEHRMGEFVIEDTVLASVGGPEPLDDTLSEAILAAHALGAARTIEQDVSFAIRQMVDIALKGLSPGVNDVTTAITAIDRLTGLLALLAQRQLESRYRTDGETLRVIAPTRTFEELIGEAYDEIRVNAEGKAAVMQRLLWSLSSVARSTRSARRRALLLQHVEHVAESARRTLAAPAERERVIAAAERAASTLGSCDGDPEPLRAEA